MILNIVCKEHPFSELNQLKAQWDTLFKSCAKASVFSSWDWTASWWKYFHGYFVEGEAQLIIFTVWHLEQLVAIAPFTYPVNAGYRMRRLRAIGDVETREGMTEYSPFLAKPGYEKFAVDSIAETLRQSGTVHPWDCAFLRYTANFEGSEATADYDYYRTTGVAQTTELPDTWQEFRSRLSRSMKTNLTYYPRKITKKGHSWSFRVASSADDVREALKELFRLHRARAKSARGVKHNDHIPQEIHASFLADILPDLAAQNRAWIALIEIDGQAVAAQAFFVEHQTLCFYYSGFDTTFYDFSPLLILAAKVIEYAIECGLTAIDFLPDNIDSLTPEYHPQEYKLRWGAKASGHILERAVFANHNRASFIKGLRNVRQKILNLAKSDDRAKAYFDAN